MANLQLDPFAAQQSAVMLGIHLANHDDVTIAATGALIRLLLEDAMFGDPVEMDPETLDVFRQLVGSAAESCEAEAAAGDQFAASLAADYIIAMAGRPPDHSH